MYTTHKNKKSLTVTAANKCTFNKRSNSHNYLPNVLKLATQSKSADQQQRMISNQPSWSMAWHTFVGDNCCWHLTSGSSWHKRQFEESAFCVARPGVWNFCLWITKIIILYTDTLIHPVQYLHLNDQRQRSITVQKNTFQQNVFSFHSEVSKSINPEFHGKKCSRRYARHCKI